MGLAPVLGVLAYPAYYCVVNAATAVLLHRRRAALGLWTNVCSRLR
jgi:hypothetical protein